MGHALLTSKCHPPPGNSLGPTEIALACPGPAGTLTGMETVVPPSEELSLVGDSRLMPGALSQHPNQRGFPTESELEGTFGIIWSLGRPCLEAHVSNQLSL